jgi:hypothetical protein
LRTVAKCGRFAPDCGILVFPANHSPLCRRHHRAKQAPGWKLDQTEPGVLIWTAPHGRMYTVTLIPT